MENEVERPTVQAIVGDVLTLAAANELESFSFGFVRDGYVISLNIEPEAE